MKFNHTIMGFGQDGVKRIQRFSDTTDIEYQSWKRTFHDYETLAIQAMVNVRE